MARKATPTPKPKVAPRAVRDVQARVQDLTDSQLACRKLQHAWAVEEDYHEVPGQSLGRRVPVLRLVLICMRGCETRRVEYYSSTRYGLDKISQNHAYADPTYQIHGVPRGVRMSTIVNQEAYRRAMEKIANAPKGAREHADR